MLKDKQRIKRYLSVVLLIYIPFSFGRKIFSKNFWIANKQRIQVWVHMDKTKAPRCSQLETEFQGLAGKAFPYRIPKILKEAHNLIFFFFFKIEWETEEHNIWNFRKGETEEPSEMILISKETILCALI